jgi:hypothetical protein
MLFSHLSDPTPHNNGRRIFAHVARRETHIHPHAGRQVDHARRASSTMRNVAASTPVLMRRLFAGDEHQLQFRFSRGRRRCGSSFHQCEPYRLLNRTQPLAPIEQQVLPYAPFLAELPHGYSAALVLRDPRHCSFLAITFSSTTAPAMRPLSG